MSVNVSTKSSGLGTLHSLIFSILNIIPYTVKTKGSFSDRALPLSCCLTRRRRPGSNTSVVRAPGDHGGGFPLHGEERNRSEEPEYHHDQELPVEQKVVTVEERHGRTNGLGTKKTNHDVPTVAQAPRSAPRAVTGCALGSFCVQTALVCH